LSEQHKTIALGYLLETLGQIARTLEAFGYEEQAATLQKVRGDIDGGLAQPRPVQPEQQSGQQHSGQKVGP